ncbi:NAD(P)-dependent oxidoreductase [Thalassobaculum salexigens]|uniref:NAD(P)-dependent oxidoreductase n=1 Tax=Thalassobaculum salexigens TaxID=455360 RepID=UPI00248E5343|nr:NAD(P)-dependent oxidoreductase [Thalassobaculum salexigens]
MRIAFLGLGLMGEGFTRRLIDLGHDVTGFDPVAERRLAASAWGATPAETPAAAAEGADLVMTCVTTTDDLEAALFGTDGCAGTMSEAAVLVDFSTTVVARTKAMAGRLKAERGAGWIDAPVSGGPPAARDGKLAIMMGGDEADIARARPVLDQLAASLVHLGPVGAGQVTKMVNQVCVLTNFVVLAEALNLAERGGVDTSRLQAALETGYAGSNLMAAMWPRMMSRDYAPAGYLRQVLKDLDMVHDLAHDLQASIPMSTQAAELFRLMAARGHAEEDGIAVLKLFTGEAV